MTNMNTVTINGNTITITENQAAIIAAILAMQATPVPVASTETAEPAAPAKGKGKGKTARKVAETVEPAAAPVAKAEAESKTAEPEYFTAFAVKAEGEHVSFTTPAGGFLYQKAPRAALNQRLKAYCEGKGLTCVYDKDKWAYRVTKADGSKVARTTFTALAKAMGKPVAPAEIQAILDGWTETNARRAARKKPAK